jgi:hypothetical protein
MKISSAIKSKDGFGSFFRGCPETWKPWLTFFKVLGGERLDAEEMALFTECTGLEDLPTEPIREVFIIAGRRSGKSTAVALLSAFYAIWGGWEKHLSKGERARIFIVSPTKSQGQIIKGYLEAIFDLNGSLRSMVKRNLQESLELVNGTTIEIRPASWRATRGFTVGLLAMEELSYWRFEAESANVDKEIYTAVKPGMTTIKNSLVVGISTPFARQGLLWDKYERHYGKSGSVLIWRAPSWRMNLSLSEAELRQDFFETLGAAEFGAEYEARFREDIETYLPLEVIMAAVVPGRENVDYKPGTFYRGFCDPAEGLRKGGDSMTFAVSHGTEDKPKKYILDFLLEFQPPFDPKEVIRQIAEICHLYRITNIVQDRHAVGWIGADLKEYNITTEVSDLTKSQIYEHFAVIMNKRQVELVDCPKLKTQMRSLMKFLRGGGTVAIDHLRSGHDDVVNSAAGAIVAVSRIEVPIRDEIQFGISYCPESLEEQLERESISWLLDRKPKEQEQNEDEEFDEEMEDCKRVEAVFSRGWEKDR